MKKRIPQSEFKRFDMKKPPKRQRLRLLIRLLSYPDVKKHRSVLTKINMENIQPPYLLLVNHNAFLDFKVVAKATLPHRTNSIVAIDGFLRGEWLLRAVGCIGKRKFTKDLTTVRHMRTVVKNGDIAVLYPEARYSLCGTNAVLPDSVGALAKLLKVPLVSIIHHGHHINQPFWNLHERGTRVESVMTGLVTADEIKKLPVEEINHRIQQAFVYDDYHWQWKNQVRVDYPQRAEGLHKVLYQCPHCMTEYRMTSQDAQLICEDCGKIWTMNEYGRLSGDDGITEFAHIPDWYEWERANVRQEIEEERYQYSLDVRVDSLPNAKGYVDLGMAKLIHDQNGFRLEGQYLGETYTVEKSVESMYSCHIEYNYLGKHGDCIDINTVQDTYYIYPRGDDFSVTKIALATEELYKQLMGSVGILEELRVERT